MTRWEELRGMTVSSLTDLVLEREAEVEQQREHIRKQAEDIIVLGREAGKAADKALIASNDHLRTEVERLTAALKDVIDDIHDYEQVNNLAPNPPRMECWDSVARARAALEPKP